MNITNQTEYESILWKLSSLTTRKAIGAMCSGIISELADGCESAGDLAAMLPHEMKKNGYAPNEQLLLALAYGLTRLGDPSSISAAQKIVQISHHLFRARGLSGVETLLMKGRVNVASGRINLGIKNIRLFLSKNAGRTTAEDAVARESLTGIAIAQRQLRLAMEYINQWMSDTNEEAVQTSLRPILIGWLIGITIGNQSLVENIRQLKRDLPSQGNDQEQENLINVISLIEMILTAKIDHERNSVILDETVKSLAVLEKASSDIVLLDSVALLPLDVTQHPASLLSRDDLDFNGLLSLVLHLYSGNCSNLLRDTAERIARWEVPQLLKASFDELHRADIEEYYKLMLSQMMSEGIFSYIKNIHLDSNAIQQKSDAAVVMLDISGYSSITETMSPGRIFETLDPIFRMFIERVHDANGEIIEFIGDALMAVFNVFDSRGISPLSILSSFSGFLDDLLLLRSANSLGQAPDLDVGIGINRGELALGSFGSTRRGHVTVLGNTVNVAARLESKTRELPGRMAVARSFFPNSPETIWETPDQVQFSIRTAGRQSVKNIQEPIEVFAIDSLIDFWVDFVPMGYTAIEEDGILYIDTGGQKAPGILDHHNDQSNTGSACALFMADPSFFLDRLNGMRPYEIEMRLHSMPDLDCAATFYTVQEHMRGRQRAKNTPNTIAPRGELLAALAAYVSEIDQGNIPNPDYFDSSLYGMHIGMTQTISGAGKGDLSVLREGLKVIDAAMFIAESSGNADFSCIFKDHPPLFPKPRAILKDDIVKFRHDLERSAEYEANVIIGGAREKRTGIWLENPTSSLFKIWTRKPIQGMKQYAFTTVHHRYDDRDRYIVSVDPETGISIEGLGQEMELEESIKRRNSGRVRPEYPRRHMADNSDPWYFGQGHHYTIIDSPFCGSVLTPEEVMAIHKRW